MPRMQLRTLRKIFNFLQKVIDNESKTNMNISNVATIFAPLLLPTPQVSDIQDFIAENEKSISFLKLLLEKYSNVGKWLLRPLFSVGEYEAFVAVKTRKIEDKCILRGDQFVVFHRSKTSVCGILNNRRIIVITRNTLEELFMSCDENTSEKFNSPVPRPLTTPRNRPTSLLIPRSTC